MLYNHIGPGQNSGSDSCSLCNPEQVTLSLSFCICKMGIIIVWVNAWKGFIFVPEVQYSANNSSYFYKLNIQKTKIMTSGPIASWHLDGETMEPVRDFIFLVSKITADGDCSHEIKRHLLLGRKVVTNLDSTLKSRDITLPTKVHLVKAMVFPGVMYGCESWTVK